MLWKVEMKNKVIPEKIEIEQNEYLVVREMFWPRLVCGFLAS